MSKEENKLFPLACRLLSEKEWQTIDDAIDSIDDPLFDEMTVDDYQRLYRLIAR
jgi:hemerythrin-like domain-containing protein